MIGRTLGTLAATAVAAGALSLIPLVTASSPAAVPVATSTASPVAATAGTNNGPSWAGWVDTMNKPGGSSKFKMVTATFTVPGINCGKSLIGSKRYPTGPYSAVAFWAGFDGTSTDYPGSGSSYNDSLRLEQAGITGTCASKGAFAAYYAWYQMTPFTVVKVPLKGLRVSDSITVTVIDTDGVTPRSVKYGNPADAGYSYSVRITDHTQHSSYYANGLRPDQNGLVHGSRAPDSSAEVITESPGLGGPYNTPNATGLAYVARVNYSDVEVTSFDTGWIYGYSMKSNQYWTAVQWNAVHDGKTLMHAGSLGGPGIASPSPFSTYWK
jgi:Peptidase A4 family